MPVSREPSVETGKPVTLETSPPPPVAKGPIEIITWSYPEEPVSQVFVNTAAGSDGKVRASRRRVTGVSPLPDAAAIARSLRPFQRRVRSAGTGEFDEEATVERAAESELILPVIGPAREKWFDAVVVFEDRPAMVVWRETIRSFAGDAGTAGGRFAMRNCGESSFQPNRTAQPRGKRRRDTSLRICFRVPARRAS